jgi:hypothetical protein
VRAAGRYVLVRGTAESPLGASLYGDVDLSSPPQLRLTLYDSVPGRPLDALGASEARRRVRFEARLGPVHPGEYDLIVGHYQPRTRLIVAEYPPAHIVIDRGSE